MFLRTLGPGVVLVAAVSQSADAWEFRSRFVERVGTTDGYFVGDTIDASAGNPRRIRLQFGLFDDANGPAPAGGFIGWNVGGILVTGDENNSDESRTPGRLAPFRFSNQPGANGVPAPLPTDPFTVLTEIDATLGTQAPSWVCGPDGQVPPMPPPVARGRNAFVSVYEITIDPRADATSYAVLFSGNLIAALEWRVVGTPVPPDCGEPGEPGEGPGSVVYAPLTAPPQDFSRTLHVSVPAPATALPWCLLLLAPARRRRNEATA